MTTSRLPYVSLINCATDNIVRGSLADQFLALSYTWGPQSRLLGRNHANCFSLQHAPLVVRDAATTVLRLGRKYLWVDRYCIDQQDETEKKMMIDNMDLIYESADATIVALYGDHDESGLPGVSIPRATQPVFDMGTGRLTPSFPAIMSLIGFSKWNTRGWTYQEARLSRRCLFFSHYQVYLVCQNSTWSEAVPYDPNVNWIAKLLNSQKLGGTLFGEDIHDGWWRDRLEYTKRDLSRQTDALDAFRGILRRSSFITLWGVPIVPELSDIDPNVGFALGLLWTKRPSWGLRRNVRRWGSSDSYRRSDFPTWSWTSLHADICQAQSGLRSKYGKYLGGNTVRFPENEANIQFWCLINGQQFSLQHAIAMTNSPILPEHSRELYVEGEFIRLRRRPAGHCNLFDEWREFKPDLPPEVTVSQSASAADSIETEVEALVLIQWADGQRHRDTKRFILMLVHWVDEDHAERIGLLTEYDDEFRCDLINNVPRIRKRFIWQ